MFAIRRTLKTSDSTSEKPISFVAWQKLLVALPALAVFGFLIWPRYGTPELIKFEPLGNVSTDSIASTQTNLSTAETTTIPKNFEFSLDQRSSSTYCNINACPNVNCFIPGTFDAGIVTSEFIETVFKIECKNTASVNLLLNNCRFSGNSLRKNWLRTSLSIKALTLDSCSLREIEDEAFGDSIFEETKTLTLVKNKLTTLRKAIFKPLTSLNELNIRENFVKPVEFNLLENVANSLIILNLDGAIDDPLALRNITGGSDLKKLETLTLRENYISEITDDSFRGTPKVTSLFLTNSRIANLSQRSLEPMSSTITQIHLSNNRISSLPKGLFDSILYREKPFQVTLDSNLWNCDCSLQWIQNVISDYPNVITKVPICSFPSENAGKSFASAQFCPSDSTGSSATESTTRDPQQATTTAKVPEKVPEKDTVTCNSYESSVSGSLRKLLSTDLQLPARIPGFLVASVTENSFALKLPNLEYELTLLWFDSGSVNRTVSCARRVSQFYHVYNIDPNTTYTICLLGDNEDTVSPLNCLTATTWPAYMSRTWLKNADKPSAIVLLTLVIVAALLAGVFATFLTVRKYPSLLRGSKRVMLVKKNLVDAIVLPKGVNVEEKRRVGGNVVQGGAKVEDGYITPLPPTPVPRPRFSRASRVSRTTLQSDVNSYVSEMEPTEYQLDSWRLARLNSDLENLQAPPLPPYPFNDGVPSLSMSVEARTEDAEYGICGF